MSRVVYENTPATSAQESLRATHGVRLVLPAEEGLGIDKLPGGVYGYTYSPGLPNAPLFVERRHRSFEMHKVGNGTVYVTGFVEAEVARQLSSATENLTVQIQPHPEDGSDALVEIPHSRIGSHKQYSSPNQLGFSATLRPAVAV
jgi:hypothetical protein